MIPLAALAPAVIAGVGSIAGGAMSAHANAAEARRNREFQERMRDTQWQAAVRDLEAAGLNPALAYMQGPNAAPSGSTMDVSQFGEGIGSAAERGLSAASARQMLEIQRATKERILAEKDATTAQGVKAQAEAQRIYQEVQRMAYYMGFGKDGKPSDDSALAAEVRRVRALASSSEYSLAEQRAASQLWNMMGSSGKMGQLAMPLLVALLRTRIGGN